MGSAALHALARRGVRALGIERFEPGHDRGSSHGESRAIRLSYAEHPSYVPLLRRAYEGWRALEAECGDTLLTVTGIPEAGRPGSPLVEGSLLASREHGIPHEVLDAAAIGRRFPAFRLPEDWTGLFQPDGGFLRPERAIAAFVDGARAGGAQVWTGTRVAAIRPRPGAVTLDTDRGPVEAGRVVVATGPWIGAFAPELAPHLTLTRQVLGWFAPPDPAAVAPEHFPVFALDAAEDTWYGFPDFCGTGVKAASHRMGRVLAQADELRQDGDDGDAAQIRAGLRVVPGADGPLTRLRTCLYTRAPDEFFVIDRAAADPRIVLASPCSGHGFKFASVIGDILADLALEGRTGHDIARFGLGRFPSAA
ncbi:MAG: N-methyl-L-tryptophan oxidase [Actinomycetospora chiangmaiensis]|nr:N-methyl-L-tryptophan oxidase [Actinomycetospora chiangmaiensis]